jgi:hypothetical protein
MDMLEKVSEKGVPIPIKMWLAAAGVDKDNLVRDHMDDEELRKQLGLAPAGQQHPDVEDEGDESAEGDADAPPAPPVTTASLKWKFGAGGFRKKPLLSRDFGDGEMFTIGKTGQKQHVPNSASKGKDANWRIAKIAASLQDPHRREQVRMRNVKTTGRDQLSI